MLAADCRGAIEQETCSDHFPEYGCFSKLSMFWVSLEYAPDYFGLY